MLARARGAPSDRRAHASACSAHTPSDRLGIGWRSRKYRARQGRQIARTLHTMRALSQMIRKHRRTCYRATLHLPRRPPDVISLAWDGVLDAPNNAQTYTLVRALARAFAVFKFRQARRHVRRHKETPRGCLTHEPGGLVDNHHRKCISVCNSGEGVKMRGMTEAVRSLALYVMSENC